MVGSGGEGGWGVLISWKIAGRGPWVGTGRVGPGSGRWAQGGHGGQAHLGTCHGRCCSDTPGSAPIRRPAASGRVRVQCDAVGCSVQRDAEACRRPQQPAMPSSERLAEGPPFTARPGLPGRLQTQSRRLPALFALSTQYIPPCHCLLTNYVHLSMSALSSCLSTTT